MPIRRCCTPRCISSPGTRGPGTLSDRGDPGASGTTVNVPVPPGTGASALARAVRRGGAARDDRLRSGPGGGQRRVRCPSRRPARRAAPRGRDLHGDRRPGAHASPTCTAKDDPYGFSKVATTFEQSPLRWRDACTCSPPDPRRRPGNDRRGARDRCDRAACGLRRCAVEPVADGTPKPTASVVVPTPSPTPALVGSTRTVLSPLGLRVHSAPALVSGNVIGGFSQGRSFSVLAYQSGGGGWFHVQGRTLAGWVVADPALTAAGTFNTYSEADGCHRAVPADVGLPAGDLWNAVRTAAGDHDSAVLETAEQPQVLRCSGAAGIPGDERDADRRLRLHRHARLLHEGDVVHGCDAGTAAGPATAALCRDAPRSDSTHAMLIGFNYQNSSQLDVFSALYNSIAFPFPLCEAPLRHRRRRRRNPRERSSRCSD